MLQEELVEPTACPLSPAGTADLMKGKVLALLIVFSMFSDLQSLINTEYRAYPEKKSAFLHCCCPVTAVKSPHHSSCNFLPQLSFLYFLYCFSVLLTVSLLCTSTRTHQWSTAVASEVTSRLRRLAQSWREM